MAPVVFQYLSWHYGKQTKLILTAWKNFLLFNINYFSIPILVKSLFAYWHKYRYSYGRGFNPSRYLEAFSSNMISRGLGAIMRIILISIGLAVEVFLFLAGLIIWLGWLLLPFILLVALGVGVSLL